MERRQCEQCGSGIGLLREGARFCSAKCRVYASRRPKFPKRMIESDRWVRRNGRKVPLAINGRTASSIDPATWSSYLAARRSNVGVGLGFCLGGGIGCWDFDHCIENGVLADWARAEIEAIESPLFIEVSQSGEGVHVFVEAREGPGWKIRDGVRCVEFYSTGRYIAVTGVPLKL